MTESQILDIKYLSIFENEYSDFDEKIMSLENSEELKKMEGAIIDRTNKGHYRCKLKHQTLFEECLLAHSKHCTPEMLEMLKVVWTDK